MRVYSNFDKFLAEADGSFGVIIGNFDGFHLGHQELINTFTKSCIKKGLRSLVITFSPHPTLFFKGEDHPYLIYSRDKKLQCLKEFGIDSVLEIPFNQDLQSMSAENFIQDYIFSIPELKCIQLGHDFALGAGKQEAVSIIKDLASQRNVEVCQVESFSFKDEVISSSLIRKLIEGEELINLEKVNELLYLPYSISGKVVNGKGLGKKELKPTANIKIPKSQIVLSHGVYITQAYIDGVCFESVTNLGHNPTVEDTEEVKVETFIFDLEKNIYDEKIDVVFLKKIRNEHKFESTEDLRNQITLDVNKAKNYFREKSENKLKMCLLGQNIAHSKSQEMYQSLLGKSVSYTLEDYEQGEAIPNLGYFRKYECMSITAPYKTHFLRDLTLEPNHLKAVNAIKFLPDRIVGTNTDYNAIIDILQKYTDEVGIKNIIILGSGAMSQMTQEICEDYRYSFEVLSRKDDNLDTFDQINIHDDFSTLVINTCSREYTFQKPENEKIHFWDMNYNLAKHINLFKETEVNYLDGLDQLRLQAKYALSFWNLKTR